MKIKFKGFQLLVKMSHEELDNYFILITLIFLMLLLLKVNDDFTYTFYTFTLSIAVYIKACKIYIDNDNS